jgi:hypothetical protein
LYLVQVCRRDMCGLAWRGRPCRQT